ncbi:MAG: YfhO family protein [Planctomycetota bacterium]|nr:YfhO family protein [Planctomycetota bacterium]
MTSDTNIAASDDHEFRITWRETLAVAALATILTIVFWEPLWTGGGLIGGDTYTYFFPQKQFFAERLHDGEFPLWNNRSGFGYPLVAESQTGAFYPPHLLIYPLLDVNEGYNAVQILHYILAFGFTWLLARELRLKPFGAIVAALIYVYGWFPPRMCLEWAIIGGTWLPLSLWWLERFLKTSHWRYLSGLSVTLGMQLLAGHFNLAFITLVLLVLFLGLRLSYWRDGVSGKIAAHRLKSAGLILGFVAIGLGIAAAQLVPTWELKQLSQRQSISDGPDFDAAYGHIPPLYLSQIIASWWFWYSPDIDLNQALGQLTFMASPAATNHTEAHLYFGLIPLFVLAAALASKRHRDAVMNRFTATWVIVSVVGIVYASGLLVPMAQHLPGFGFFRGPARWGILAALGVGLIIGKAAGAVLENRSRLKQNVLCSTIFVLTAIDLWYVSSVVSVTVLLERSPLPNIQFSPVRNVLDHYAGIPRVYGPGPNLLNLLGHASVPEYLGIGPAEYYAADLKAPPFEGFTPDFLDWCYRAGITHVLTFEPPQLPRVIGTPAELVVVHEPDSFLNPAWARGFLEPIYLVQLSRTRDRFSFADTSPDQRSESRIELISYRANSATVETDTDRPETVVMTDLYFPGWTVTIDGEPADGYRFEGMFRAVDVPAGQHTIEWSYHPASVRNGLWVSGLSIFALLAIGHVRFWHFNPKRIASGLADRGCP